MTGTGGGGEPRWLSPLAVRAMHTDLIRQHGGEAGLRDEGLLESALARPRNKWAYEDAPDLSALAAAYAGGLVRNHPFVDGNKRAAFMAAYTFLAINGRELDAPEPEAVAVMTGLAAGDVSEDEFANWLRANVEPLDQQGA